MTATAAPSDRQLATEFVLRLGRALHQHGFSASRLEEVMVRSADVLGLPGAQVFSTPTSIFAAFGPTGAQQVHLLRVEPGTVNLGQLAELDRVAGDVLAGRATPREGLAALDRIEHAPAPYATPLVVLAFAASSAAVARFLGGGLREILVAAGNGLLTGLLAAYAARHPRVARVFEPVAAFAVSALSGVLAAAVLPMSVYVATLAGLIVLIPGFQLTIGIRELATAHLSSGTMRMSAATVTFLGIIFGVALGDRAAELAAGRAHVVPPTALPPWTVLAATLVAGLAFAVVLGAQRRDMPWVVLAGFIAVLAGRFGARLLGLELGALVGSLAVGVAGHALSRWRGRPSVVMLVPGTLMLVPGTLGFRSLSALLEAEVVSGVGTAFRMVLTAVAIVSGLLLADIVSPQRRIA